MHKMHRSKNAEKPSKINGFRTFGRKLKNAKIAIREKTEHEKGEKT